MARAKAFSTTAFCAVKRSPRGCPLTTTSPRLPLVVHSTVYDYYDSFSLLSNSDVAITSTSFEPQLNVPAFAVFLLISIIFSFLQFRIARIGEAADRRTESLEQLRSIKAKELSGQVADQATVDQALQAYKEALEEVESLRTIVPGVRIAPPPASQSLTRQRMDENVAAAKQFLGVDLDPPAEERNESPGGLSPGLVAMLALVVVMQIGLLGLLSVDPMAGSDFMDTVDTLTGLE